MDLNKTSEVVDLDAVMNKLQLIRIFEQKPTVKINLDTPQGYLRTTIVLLSLQLTRLQGSCFTFADNTEMLQETTNTLKDMWLYLTS